MGRKLSVVLAFALATFPAVAATAQPVAAQATDARLVALFREWRAFVRPAIRRGVPDYSTAAMARQAAALPAWRARLNAVRPTDANIQALNDWRMVEAEMNGLDFFQRVLMPWARDPSFYANVFADQSDVPAHEGPSAEPTIDLFKYKWPLSRTDDARLTEEIGAVPAMLAAAKTNLAGSQAHDLWAYGNRAFAEQGATLDALGKGTLRMRTLEGRIPATMTGVSPKLHRAIMAAKAATDDFAAWVAAEAPRRTGPSGVGKANYDWYVRNVERNPYGWDQQVLLLQRELDRSIAGLRLEEARNAALPPIAEIADPAAYRRMAAAKTRAFNDFLVAKGFVADRPYFRAALEAQTSDYIAPADRDFFGHGTALDPLPLLSHSTHWIELARLKHEPHASPMRAAPLFNIYADRSEGFATAMEEVAMQAGLYDDNPHAREVVWIMLANRAARGLASLRVQANEWDLATAGRFHAEWTPRGWSDANSKLVGFEQLLYLRQPGYGPSYVIGKLQLDALIARASHDAEQAKRPFVLRDVWARIIGAGIMPPAMIEEELFGPVPAPR
ncbi:DUF885 domain-containing protein [Sphingomonas sp. SUN019]|uniref:DUF885 domain-containing protein n=1 Tax=Sphingomonas sp. SUN019 TaxID=2937788 RepID=UPI0021646D29|nr:DUF885 domain-containing protein [Sphingomonas sp. SUN019]UVO50747.1 DUF885 domain-containing protein [Sphingomonas sp. SUN019]